MAQLNSAPRIYCIPATNAPVVAVFRRGPTDWAHVGRWDLTAGTYESGAWLRARMFPRRSDLSPDGRWLSYFAHDPRADWEHGEAYVAVSRLPWLKALHAFGTCGTWTRGYHFTEDGSFDEGDESSEQESAEFPIDYGLRSIPSVQFANERRRGWAEAPDSPPRVAGDMWDERRNARMEKRQPGGSHILRVESLGWAAVSSASARLWMACTSSTRWRARERWSFSRIFNGRTGTAEAGYWWLLGPASYMFGVSVPPASRPMSWRIFRF